MLSAALGVLVEETETQVDSPTIIEEAIVSSSDHGSDQATKAGLEAGSTLFDGLLPLDETEAVEVEPANSETERRAEGDLSLRPAFATDLAETQLSRSADGTAASEVLPTGASLSIALPTSSSQADSESVSDYTADAAGSAVEEMLASGLGLAAPPPDPKASSAASDSSVNSFFGETNTLITDSLTSSSLSEQTVSWLGGSTSWSTASSWSTGVLPTAADHVVIDLPGGFTLFVDGQFAAASVTLGGAGLSHTLQISSGNSLTVSGDILVRGNGTLALFGTLSVGGGLIEGELRWAGGVLAASGAGSGTLELASDAVTLISNPGTKTLQGLTLFNRGTSPGTLDLGCSVMLG